MYFVDWQGGWLLNDYTTAIVEGTIGNVIKIWFSCFSAFFRGKQKYAFNKGLSGPKMRIQFKIQFLTLDRLTRQIISYLLGDDI